MRFKTIQEIEWFMKIYNTNLGKGSENTLNSIWITIFGVKRTPWQKAFIRELISCGAIKQIGEIRKIGEMRPIYMIDRKKMKELLEETDVYKSFVGIYREGRIVI